MKTDIHYTGVGKCEGWTAHLTQKTALDDYRLEVHIPNVPEPLVGLYTQYQRGNGIIVDDPSLWFPHMGNEVN
jgi:hypothetical protein